MTSLAVLFWYGSSFSLFSRKLVEFGAYANALDHLHCSHGVHSVFYNIFFISGSKSLSHHWRQLLALAFVLFILTILISDCICLAHIVEIGMNSLSILFWDGSLSSFFLRKVFELWACVNSLDHLDFRFLMFSSHSWIQEAFTLSFYFLMKLFKFRAYAYALDHLNCNYGVMAIFYNKCSFQEAKFSPLQWSQLLELGLVLFFLVIWISDWLCLAHIV